MTEKKKDSCSIVHGKDNPVNALQQLQKEKGYLPKEEMINLAKRCQLPGVDLYGVATFYSQFKIEPPAQHKICVCTGTACHVKGSADLLVHIEEFLKIKPGEKTQDSRISLETVNCIGACALAPAMTVNGRVYGQLTKERVEEILRGLR